MPYEWVFALNLGRSKTGLSLRAQLVDETNTPVGGEISTGFYEVGLGLYYWHAQSIPDGHRGGVTFTSFPDGENRGAAAINPETNESEVNNELLEEILAKVRLIGTGVIVVAPVLMSGSASVVRGDSYYAADDRALEWINPQGTWPDLTSATVTFTAKKASSTLTKAATVVTATGSNQTVRLELTEAETAALSKDAYRFDLEATLATSSHKVTLVAGEMYVRDGVTS